MPSKAAPSSLYQLKITLLGIDPPIWRRIQVPSTMLLCCLHDAVRAVMGWTDSHLHQFEKDGKYWGQPEHYEFDDIDVFDVTKVSVGSVLKANNDALVYLYDFGDDWRLAARNCPGEDPATHGCRPQASLHWRSAALPTGRCRRRAWIPGILGSDLSTRT
jgi:hypothetical protein